MKKSIVILLHLGYWVMYLFLLAMFFKLTFMDKPNATHQVYRWSLLMFEFALLPGFICFYSFYTVLFSRFLARKKVFYFFTAAILISLAATAMCQLIMHETLNSAFPHINWSLNTCLSMGSFMALNAFANGLIGVVLQGFITGYSDIKLKEELNKKNYEMELALVKSQMSPHFLFNTINNIDVLIEKDAAKASNYLNKLSDILRFMLYETMPEKIPLSKELSYIDKYIELQKIRTSNLNYVNYSVEGNPNNIMIAPMLFIPFIENAFKHAENKKIENAINITIAVSKRQIVFSCENSYVINSTFNKDKNGLGNEIIQRRLVLLYPDKHQLEVIDNNNVYKVKLQLDFEEN